MKVAIVGSGLGGLASASQLVGKHEVDIYEREAVMGGRAMSLKVGKNYKKILAKFEMANAIAYPSLEEIDSNYTIDLGFHLIGGGKRGACVKALKRIDAKVEFIGSRLGYIGEKIRYPMLSNMDKISMLPRIIQLITASHEKIERMNKMSMEEAIEKYGKGKLKMALKIFPRLITTVNDLSKISAGETFFAQRELMGGHPVIYPVGGLKSISHAFALYIQRNGGKIFLKKEIKNVEIENGVAKGIDGMEYDVVILNMPVQHIFKVAGERHFPNEWVRKIKKLKGTGSMVAYHVLNHINPKLLDKSFVFLEKNDGFAGNELAGMIDFKMASQHGILSPKKKYIVQSYIICSPEEAKDKRKWYDLVAMIDKNLEKLVPDYKKSLEWSIYNTIWHLDGVAKTIDNEKPGVATPVKNLYIVGDSVNSKGIGINCAIDSARLLENHLYKFS